jgi:hypothetical protein
VALYWRRHVDPFGVRGLIEVYWAPLDEEVYGPDPTPTVASTGYEIVAQLLAAPLRRAFDEHLRDHGCAERGGFGYCDEAMRLFGLLPAGDSVIFG